MSDIAIRVENLSKSYQITHSGRGKYKTLQEDVIGFLKRPFSRRADGPSRETFWALKDVSFEVKHGEVLGIIGRNGAGKSTLLKILSRITKPTSGYAEIYGRVGSLLEVGTGFHPELTGRENIFLNGAVLGMSRRDIMKHFDEIVAFADVEQFLDTPAKRYSSGMYMRLAFAVAAHLEPEVLVVDEVLAVGDAEFQKKCLGKMSEVAKSGRTVLFVSHNMAAVSNLCSRVVWLNSGEIVHQGDTSVIQLYLAEGSDHSTDRIFEDQEKAPGNDRVRLRRVRVLNNDSDEQPSRLTMTTPVRLEFEYWNLREALLNLSLHVFSSDGSMAFNTAPVHDTYWMTNPQPPGLFRATCVIPGYLLNSGSYSVELLFVEDQAHVIFALKDALVFDIDESPEVRGASTWFGKWPGILHPRCDWRTHYIELYSGEPEKVGQI